MGSNRIATRILASITASFLAVVGLGVTASPASAAFDGHCGNGEFCLYYNTNLSGGVADFSNNISNYAGYNFWGTGGGLNDNAASAHNNGNWQDVHLHEAANYSGANLEFNVGVKRNTLGAMANRGSSHKW
ncbi:peptidase inhibitor family I36 protein [Actinoplanes sp. NPDC051346]|uniref:peptidase inhibitor family I36 protein n=1 Tax=Actinoplanes sp. NPDC051346 TaxID=3155048 RepID=UPI00341DB87B